MATFYTDSGSFSELEVSGSVLVSGSGRDIFAVSGSNGGLLSVSDLTAGANVFQITSASVDVFKINQSKEVHVSGSLIVTGSILGASINVSAGTTSNNVSQLILSNANGVSFGLDNNTITATAAGVGGGFTFNYFNPQDAYVQVTHTYGVSTLVFMPFQCPNVQFDRIAMPFYFSQASNSTANATLSARVGFYTRSVSTLNLVTDLTVNVGGAYTFSTTNASLYHGLRLWTAGFTNTLTEGQYYVGILSLSTTAGSNVTWSNIAASQQASSFSGLFGAATNSSQQYTRGLGRYSAVTSNLPSSVAISQIYGQSSGYLRQPIFYLVSQTF